MGKRIRAQRKGRGSPAFRASTHKRVAPARYRSLNELGKESAVCAVVEELVHEPGRGSPLAKLKFKDGKVLFNVVPEGLFVGQEIVVGSKALIRTGNVLPLGKIPSGTIVCNLELFPGDGGKIARSSGTYATVVSHSDEGTRVKFPSGRSTYLRDLCRATIGVVSGAGRPEKPFLKAGAKAAWMGAKGHPYPINKGVAMNAAMHPHGGGAHKSSSLRPTTTSRNAPPGQKVGLIAARQSGRKKRHRDR